MKQPAPIKIGAGCFILDRKPLIRLAPAYYLSAKICVICGKKIRYQITRSISVIVQAHIDLTIHG